MVYGAGLAHEPGEARDDLEQVQRHDGDKICLLGDEADLMLYVVGVMGRDLCAEAILHRRDDAPAIGVVLGIGARHDEQVQRQPQGVAAHLDIALLEHVEQRHLDALGEVGELVDREDAAVGAGHEPEVNGLGIAQHASLGHLDRVDIAHEIAHRGVGRGELLAVALAAVAPRDRRVIAALGDDASRVGTHRCHRVVVDLGAVDDGDPLVEQRHEGADQTRLALASLTE